MLLKMHSVLGRNLVTRDGKTRQLEDFLVDDRTWSLRFLKASLGGWFRRPSSSPPCFCNPTSRTKSPFLSSSHRRKCATVFGAAFWRPSTAAIGYCSTTNPALHGFGVPGQTEVPR